MQQFVEQRLGWRRRILQPLLVLMSCLAGLSDDAECASRYSSDSDQAGEQFLRRLMQKQFFDLARHYCVQQARRSTSDAYKARWQLRLGEVYAQQAWMSSASNRESLLKHAVELITSFLEDHNVSPERQFLLRVQQAQLLSQTVQMKLVEREGGRLFARRAREAIPIAESGVPRTLAPRQERELKTLVKSQELLEGLLKQLETQKRDLDGLLATRIRDSARLHKAEARLMRWRILREAKQPGNGLLIEELDEELSKLSRSTRTPEIKAMAQLRLAELSLHSLDRRSFALRIRSPTQDDLQQSVTLPEFLSVRSLLSDQEVNSAIDLLQTPVLRTAVQQQHLIWLRLECRLGLFELAEELQVAAEIDRSKSEFTRQLSLAGNVLRGVFRDAAEATSARFRLVDEVGVEVADLVRLVDVERSAGQPQAALRLIERALVRLTPDAKKPRAALLLRAGEIHVESGSWPDAFRKMEAAGRLYAQLQMTAEQATADLMRIYAMSRMIGHREASDAAGPPAFQQADYVQALEWHLSEFGGQRTMVNARQWLLLAVRDSDPDRAARLAMDVYRAAERPTDRIRTLKQVGELLRKSRRDIIDQTPALPSLHAEFVEEYNIMSKDTLLFPASDLVCLAILIAEMEFENDVKSGRILDEYPGRIQSLSNTLRTASRLTQAQRTQFLRRCELLEIVVAARIGELPENMERIRQMVLATTQDQLDDTIGELVFHLRPEKDRPGDGWLAGVTTELLKRELDVPTNSTSTSASRLVSLLPMVVRVSQAGRRADLLNDWIQVLIECQLSDIQMTMIAETLSAVATDLPGQKADQEKRSPVRQFWQSILERSKEGDPMWFEAQLNIAAQEIRDGRPEQAGRRLGVVSTLFPDWGGEERLQRARNLELLLAR